MPLVLLTHAVVGILIITATGRVGRSVFAMSATAHAASLAWAASVAGDVINGRPRTYRLEWVPGLNLAFDLRVDAFSLLMIGLVSGVGLLVSIYAAGYFGSVTPATARLMGLLTLFAGAMLGVVVADHLMALFVFWELTSITSYLLIGNNDTDARARASALQALLITGVGGLVMLAGLIIVGQSAGTYRLSELATDPPTGTLVGAGLVCILVGCFTKSAQVPFGGWLPGAMVAPTPVSAYLHSATMVKAGVYLIARLAPMFATIEVWRPVALVAGTATAFFGGWRALRQYDLKLLLAFGTVSQLGLLVVILSTGEVAAAQAGMVLLVAHGAFKAALFMVVGIIDHQVGTRDIRSLHGFDAGWRPTVVIAAISAASMAGLPPFLGFVAKEKALAGLIDGSFGRAGVVLVAIAASSVLTVAYSGRFVLGVLGRFGESDAQPTSRQAPAPRLAFVAPAAVLTAFTVVSGLMPQSIDRLIRAATESIHPAETAKPVVLWAGFNAALWWSVVIVIAGVLLIGARVRVYDLQRRLHRGWARMPSSERIFESTIRATLTGADRVTSVVQSGSQPIYLAIIVTTVVGFPLLGFARDLNEFPEFVSSSLHLALGAIIIACAIGAAAVRHRMAAALLLGAVGYAMAGVYVSLGAPDVALTQVAIETIATVLFVLVLRFLPSTWEHRSTASARSWRIAIAALVGAAMFVYVLVAAGLRANLKHLPVSAEMIQRAYPDGKGRNIVNVILVDFRGLDTFGEIAVLAVTSLGAVSLAKVTLDARHRRADMDERP